MPIWLYRVLTILGLSAFSLAVWIGGPLIGFGEVRPLDGFWIRFAIVFTVLAIAGGIFGYKYWKRRKAAKALEAALVEQTENEGDSKVLGEKMQEALDTLKRSSGKSAYLYDLPWYVIVGPPGAGKTTALVNSGLKFPLAGAGGAAAIAGTGGTRYCDWWFTEDAVLIDTAGRYTTQDSDAEADKKSWQSFLSLLKTNRPKQPINGVIVAISVEDLLKLPQDELAVHAHAIRKRLLEMHQELKVDFPVYALFTKADLISGFSEYFGNFTESRRRKVWGATFQTTDRKKNMVGEVPAEFDDLVKRLTEEMTDRLHEEPDAIARIAIFGFPEQFALLREKVAGFLNLVFEPTRYQSNANLRGFYFSSGTQEGTPIDQVLGAMDRSFGEASAASRYMSGSGRSYFLHDLLKQVIFAESGWVSVNIAAMRRAMIIRYGSIAAMSLATIVLLGAWGWSYASNRALIRATENAMDDYRVNADAYLKATTVSDTELHEVLGVLHQLRNMPVGYSTRAESVPARETFGLSQRARLVSSSETSYRQALERMFRSRLILRLERTIEANINDPIVLYEALKVYMMLGGVAPKVDRELIVAWMRQDWEQNLYPGRTNRQGREQLEEHLRAMLELGAGREPSFTLNGPLLEQAQRTLARMNMADQAYALVKSAVYSAPLVDFAIANRAGPDAAEVFETVDGSDLGSLVIPGLYTYSGFHDFFLNQLAAVAEKLIDEQWVMGEYGKQDGVEAQFERLGPTLLDRYAAEFVEAWNKAFDNLKFKNMSADKPTYVSVISAGGPNSPVRILMEEVARETQLTLDAEEGGEESGDIASAVGSELSLSSQTGRELTNIAADQIRGRVSGLARIGINLAMRKSQARAGSSGGGGGGSRALPGANVEVQFRPFHLMVEGESGRRPVDALVQLFYNISQSLLLAATTPSQAERANQNLQLQIFDLRSSVSRLPRPVARMVNQAVEDFEGDAAGTSLSQLNQILASNVTRRCQEIIGNRYPFSRQSTRDVPMSDFAALFAPQGIIDRFFVQHLQDMVDMGGDSWEWKQDTRLGRELSRSALRDFQRAAEIRDAFFPQGGSMPNVNVTVGLFSLHAQAEMALLNVNGQVVQAQQVGSVPGTIQWPGSMGQGSVSISLTPELEGRSSSISLQGPWAFMRLIDSGSVGRSGDSVRARFVLGGRDVAYNIQVASLKNPFFLPALTEFNCPAGL